MREKRIIKVVSNGFVRCRVCFRVKVFSMYFIFKIYFGKVEGSLVIFFVSDFFGIRDFI